MPFDLESNAIGLLLSRTYFTYKKETTHLLHQYDITPEQFGILGQLQKTKGISQKILAEIHGKDQTSVGKTLDRLERKELIIRSVDPTDRRAIVLQLSEKGQELFQQARVAMQESIDQINELFTEEEADQLITSLNKIYRKLSGA
jgi:DNA-binding MarR family transcriptional regulator